MCTQVTNCISAHERVILVFISRHQNNTRVSAETVRRKSTYIVLFLTRHNESINNDKPTIFTHCSRVSLTRFSFCWWRHNRSLMTSQWLDNCDAVTRIVISNSLDIDFIHGYIHGWSCKKILYSKKLLELFCVYMVYLKSLIQMVCYCWYYLCT